MYSHICIILEQVIDKKKKEYKLAKEKEFEKTKDTSKQYYLFHLCLYYTGHIQHYSI